jgi:hypothetical protein
MPPAKTNRKAQIKMILPVVNMPQIYSEIKWRPFHQLKISLCRQACFLRERFANALKMPNFARQLKFRYFLILVLGLNFWSGSVNATNMKKGFEALEIYDYFKAKKIFSQGNKKHFDAYASYGLAWIYMKRNNPFHNLDSAAKYVNVSYNTFLIKSVPLVIGRFNVDSASIIHLADSISFLSYVRAKKVNSIEACNAFLQNNYLGRKRYTYEIVYLRDELEYNMVMSAYRSDSTRRFIQTHPQSTFLREALILLDRQVYDEITTPGKAETYVLFLKKYPRNIMATMAYEKLFGIYRQRNDVKGLREFVVDYPKAPQNLEAWKLLFSLTVKTYSYSELKKFLDDYPKFPLKNSILKDLELNKLVLYPCREAEFSGFIDNKGKFVIRPQYDEVTDFFEGLAVVSKGDSVFFINKENENPFGNIYAEALIFRNGIAPVKLGKQWHFINRQGQTISRTYDEISELSDGVYVIKQGEKYGALDQYGQTLIEPQFDKLGDFKNEMAYFVEGGNYGFVSRNGSIHKAEFEWISDFNEENLAVIRQNGQYGLINAVGKKVLEPQFDQVLKGREKIFILVKENQYGFFSADGCLLTQVTYDFLKEKGPEFYTDGLLLKLQKKTEQTLMDQNGKIFWPMGTYDEVNFPSEEHYRIKQKNKFGFLDKKLAVVIPPKYQSATDFIDSLSVVKLKDKFLIIEQGGKELYSSKTEITRIGKKVFAIENEQISIISGNGYLLFSGVESYTRMAEGPLLIRLSNGEMKLLYD